MKKFLSLNRNKFKFKLHYLLIKMIYYPYQRDFTTGGYCYGNLHCKRNDGT